MAEALAIEGAKWAASTIVTGLLKEGFYYLGIDISTKLLELETTILPQLQFVIEAAERSSVHKNTFQSWLRRLKDAVYEAEDVLDLYKYQEEEEKVSDLNTRPALKPFKRVARKINAKLSIKLKTSLNKLEKIAAEAKELRKNLKFPIGNDGTVAQNFRQPEVTTSSLDRDKVFGRETELDKIIEYLKSASEKRYSVITIVGIGGVGKTTLAQLVCKDEWVVNHFDIKIWVCVSRKLDLSRYTTQMIESSSMEGCSLSENLDAMQNKLAELVKSKKVLLVLDDVWWDESTDNTETDWETFLRPLATSVESGSKVLVTTRTNNLPRALRPRPEYSMALKDLEENDILSLFKHSAFDGTNLDGSQQEELMKIGNQIVHKLYRSPLAAKTVACQLNRTLNVDAWRSALTRNNLGDSQRALLWSYQRLDAPLQRCFSYFSLFPKGHKYEAEEMVHLWIAEGFINSSNNGKRMEDIGMEYFDKLVSGSFIWKDKNGYYMHDLFHDLAENVSKEDCLRIEDDQVQNIPPTARHLSILGQHMTGDNMSFNELENLRTLIIRAGSLSSHATANIFAAIAKSTKLRVLMINSVSRETLTKDIADLKHLRFLSFNDALPATLGKLYHLQFLVSPDDASLPSSVKNLINLRCFEGGDAALASLTDIGRLTSLQNLPKFVVKKDRGHDIGQLKNLNKLRKSLTISNLENVEGKYKATEADIGAKSHLEQLHLEWDNNNDDESEYRRVFFIKKNKYRRDLDMEVLQGLQPHLNLKKLSIKGYKSPQFPSWLLQEGCLPNLRSLMLQNCTALEVLPPISNLFPNCSELEIQELCKLREFPSLSQSFKKIVIRDCPLLIIAAEEESILPSSLQTLELRNCNITDEVLSQSLRGLTSLKYLELRNISTITTLPAEGVLHHLTALTFLSIHSCPAISSLPEHLPESLVELSLRTCPSISSLPEHLPQSLRTIMVKECPILERRCQSPNGKDWPKIAHIPHRRIHPRRMYY